MTNSNDKTETTIHQLHRPTLSMYIILDEGLMKLIQEALTTQHVINNTPQNTDSWKDAKRHMRYLREEIGTRIVWQFKEALRGDE